MKIKKQINKIISFTGYSLKKIQKETIILKSLPEIPEDEYQVLGEDLYYLNLLNVKINPKNFDYLIRGYEMAKLLKLKREAVFEVIDDRLICEINKMKCFICTWEELLILKEIYIDGIYNYSNNNKSVLIDIGMNVGLTSLFFANKINFTNIYSFEPFKPTFDAAQENFKLNDELSKKIFPFNFGLGAENTQIEIPYNYEYKGSMGIQGLPKHIQIDDNNVTYLNIEIRSIVSELNIIKEKHKDSDIVVKMDCEGSEYVIIEKLVKENLLKYIDVVLMEWHIKGSSYLVEKLIDAGFEVFSFNETNENIGMIYGINKGKKIL